MNLINEVECSWSEINPQSLDIVICACGYESRASNIALKLADTAQAMKLAFCFKDRPVLERRTNDALFKNHGYDLRSVDGSSRESVLSILGEAIGKYAGCGQRIRILVDYSCMTRVWYAAIIEYLRDENLPFQVEVLWCYSPSSFSPPPRTIPPNVFMGPLPGFSGLQLPSRPTSLVIGLGYERYRAMGLFQYVEPAEAYLFHAYPVFDEEFVNESLRNNKDLIETVGPDRILKYPLPDLTATRGILESLCRSLVVDGRVIVAPLGPKPFSLVSLLLAVRFDGIDIWRVSAGSQEEPIDRKPVEEVMIYRSLWETRTGERLSVPV